MSRSNLSDLVVRDRWVGGAAVDSSPGSGSGPTTVSWGAIPDKPTEFPPEAHTHPLGDLEQSGASPGEVPVWSGSAWLPGSGGVGSGGWVPLVDGAEPPVLISDGDGVLMLVAL